MIYDCIIVGAGAAGLFCAASADFKINGLILEKTARPGTKLLMSGGGQCNITHSGSVKDFICRYGKNGRKIRSCLYKYNNLHLQAFLHENGILTITREDGKVFPKSMNPRDILDMLQQQAIKNGFQLRCNTQVTRLTRCESQNCWCAETKDNTFLGKNLIIAAGGCSYPSTGSDGNLFPVLTRDLDVQISPLAPALTPVFVENYPYRQLTGISFENAELQLWRQPVGKEGGAANSSINSTAGGTPAGSTDFETIGALTGSTDFETNGALTGSTDFETNGAPTSSTDFETNGSLTGSTDLKTGAAPTGSANFKKNNAAQNSKSMPFRKTGSYTGPLLLTAENFSGPLILNASRDFCAGDRILLNYLYPLKKEEVLSRINSAMKKSNAQLSNLLPKTFRIPKNFAASIIAQTGEKPKAVASKLTEDTFTISALGGFRKAMATTGGISLSEINAKTMECKKHHNLYFIGEMLDIDGETGGYNLQFAYSSACAAINSVCASLSE